VFGGASIHSIRLAGVLAAVLFIGYGFLKYRKGNWSKLDLSLVLLISTGIASLSIFPPVGDVLQTALHLNNRLFSLLVFSNLLLFGLFFFLLNLIRASNRRSREIVRALARYYYNERYFSKRESHSETLAADKGKLLVVIPAYNEQEAILGVLTRLPKELAGHDVEELVVVDGATDATEAMVFKNNFKVASHIVNCGGGDALRTGFEIACAEGADIVVNMDADGQHQPEEIERLIAPIVKNEADFVVGSRFLGHYEERGSIRHVGIVLFSWLVSLLTGAKVTDCTNGFRALRVSSLERLRLQEEQFHTTELIIEALKRKLRYKEVPVSVLRRREGESKKPKRLRYPFGVLRTIIHTWLR
jgi:hypothetical protein